MEQAMHGSDPRDAAPAWRRRTGWLDKALTEAGRALRVLDGSVAHERANPAGPPLPPSIRRSPTSDPVTPPP